MKSLRKQNDKIIYFYFYKKFDLNYMASLKAMRKKEGYTSIQ